MTNAELIAEKEKRIKEIEAKLAEKPAAEDIQSQELEAQEAQLRAGAEAYMAFDPDTAYSWLRDADALKLRRENAASASKDKAEKQRSTDTYKYLKNIAPSLGQAQSQPEWDGIRSQAIASYPELAELIPITLSQKAKNAVWTQAGQKEMAVPTPDSAEYQEERRRMSNENSQKQIAVQGQITSLKAMQRDDNNTFRSVGGQSQINNLMAKQKALEEQAQGIESGAIKPYSWATDYASSLVAPPAKAGAQAPAAPTAQPQTEAPAPDAAAKTTAPAGKDPAKKPTPPASNNPVVITDLADIQKYVDDSDRTKTQRYEEFKKEFLNNIGGVRKNTAGVKDIILNMENKMKYLVEEAARNGGAIKGMGADKLIYDYSKSVDPNSVVMIGEFNRIAANAGELNNAISQFFSSLGGKLDVINSGKVKELYDIMKNSYNLAVQQYNNINSSANSYLGDQFALFPWKGGAKVTPMVNITKGWAPPAAPVLGSGKAATDPGKIITIGNKSYRKNPSTGMMEEVK